MRLYLVLLLSHLTSAIWLPFVNLDTMFATLKEATFGQQLQEPVQDPTPLYSYAKLGMDFVTNLKKIFSGNLTQAESKKLAHNIRKIFNVTTTAATRFTPMIYTVAPTTQVPIQKFTFPYTRPYIPTTIGAYYSTVPRTTTSTKPSTTTTTTTTARTTTRSPTTISFYPVTTTHESLPIPRHTTYSPVKIWPTTRSTTQSTTTWVSTTPRRITWKYVKPNGIYESTTPLTSTEGEFTTEATTKDNIPAIIKERRLTRLPIRPTSTTSTPVTGTEVCKPGSRCTISLRSFNTADPVLQYAYSHSTSIDDTLQNLLRDTQATTYPPPLSWSDSVTPEVIQLAQSVMTVYRPSRCLVVGIFTGLGLLGVAEYVDARGIVVGLEHPEYANFWETVGLKHAKKLSMGHISRIQVRSAEEIERALPRLAATDPNTFDFIFVDDFKRTNYLDDYEHSIRLLRSGGLLIINRAFNEGGVLSGAEYMTPEDKIIRDMNIRIKQDGRVRATLLPTGDGTWLIAKK